jgi:hypothetical protein
VISAVGSLWFPSSRYCSAGLSPVATARKFLMRTESFQPRSLALAAIFVSCLAARVSVLGFSSRESTSIFLAATGALLSRALCCSSAQGLLGFCDLAFAISFECEALQVEF